MNFSYIDSSISNLLNKKLNYNYYNNLQEHSKDEADNNVLLHSMAMKKNKQKKLLFEDSGM